MPFKSKAQAAFLREHFPDVYEKFRKETPKGVKLPLRVKNKKNKKR